ncbi:MAG: hypothetical protein AMXMBFR82_03450 [Candidatus Hydrogenedentota bacterium]
MATNSGCRSDGLVSSRDESSEPENLIEEDDVDFVEYEAYVFRLQIPANVTIEESQQADFFRYEFYLREDPPRSFMVTYDAAFPPFPARAPKTAQIDIASKGKVEKRSVSWRPNSDSGLQSREFLYTYQKSKEEVPMRLHLMYSDLPEREARIADQIIESVRYYKD